MSDALEVVTAPDPVHHPGRVHELRSAVGSLKVRAGRGGVDRYLFIAACVLVPLGLERATRRYIGSAAKRVTRTRTNVAMGERTPAARKAMPG